MTLSERIDQELTAAMKGRNERTVSTLRMLKAAMANVAIQRQKATLEDAEVLEVIQKLMKQHQESVEAYKKGGRPDLAEKESAEAQILQAYLPPAMDEGELKAIIEATVKELGNIGPAAVGQVMKAVMQKVKGRCDGKRVNQLVAQALAGS